MPWISRRNYREMFKRLEDLEARDHTMYTNDGGGVSIGRAVRALANYLDVEFEREPQSAKAVKKAPRYEWIVTGGGGGGGQQEASPSVASAAPKSTKRRKYPR